MKNIVCVILLCIPCLLLLLSVKQGSKLTPENFSNFKEYSQDYDYLVQMLKDNYPYWNLAERQGRNAMECLSAYRNDAIRAGSLAEFYSCVERGLSSLENLGHLRLISPSEYTESLFPIYQESQDSWGRAICNPITEKSYRFLISQIGQTYSVKGTAEKPEAGASVEIELQLLEQDDIKIGILTIPSFFLKMGANEQDHAEKEIVEIFEPFYQQCVDCDHIIFDIRKNGGGSDSVWQYGIVAPNLEQELGCFYIGLGRNSSLNRQYLSSIGVMEHGNSVSFLPELGLCPTDMEDMTHYWIFRKLISPSGAKKAFSGHLWVLTSSANYSAAENFVSYCKATGFATLVGESTSGGGGGVSPAFIVLPNTGLLVQYDMLCRINPDGTLNEENGTVPDISAPSNQTALETCLKEIRKQYCNTTF